MTRTSIVPLALIGVLLVSACQERRADRIAFDGVFFRSNASNLDRLRDNFEVTVRPVSASLEGARDAGRHEAIRYCIKNFGSSDITWIAGPDAEDGTLNISGDRLVLRGTCTPE